MNPEDSDAISCVVLGLILCAGICVFFKWRSNRNNYDFKLSRVFLFLSIAFLIACPFTFLAWYFWPLQTKQQKFLPLLAWYVPCLALMLFGYWKIFRRTSAEEIFDIVNERDEVVGQNTRREVHARGLWHRAVHVLVFNARGEVFLQKRSLKKDTAADKWDSSASGHLD